MTREPAPHNQDRADRQEISPLLRKAVDQIVADQPAPDVAQGMIDRLRDLDPNQVQPGAGSRTAGWFKVGVVLAMAASLMGVLVLWHLRSGGVGQRDLIGKGPGVQAVPVPSPSDDLQPAVGPRSLWTYHQAARRSAEDLVLLLDQQSREPTFTDTVVLRLGMPPVSKETNG